jgi:hypothetical protein
MKPKLLFIIFLSIFLAQTAEAYQVSSAFSYDIFYLAVGNSHYQKAMPADKDSGALNEFPDLDGANKSAKKMASYLDAIGAVSGITLTGEDDKLVTRSDVFKALGELLDKVEKSKSANPLIIFYFCGHGLSEGVGWNHFSIPGDFLLPSKFMNVTAMAENTVYAGDVAEMIEKVSSSYMLMLDSCYEGDAPLPAEVFSRQSAQNLTDIFKVLRTFNEFRGPGIAVFATKPGTQVKIADDPFDSAAAYGLGPIARRALLIFEQTFKAKNNLSLARFLQQISNPAFDKPTTSVMTLSVPGKPNINLIKKVKRIAPPRIVINGTGVLRPVSEDNQTKETSASRVAPVENVLVSPDSYLSFESPPDEYVGRGKNMTLSAKDYKFSAANTGREEITISIESDNTSWEISLAAPRGKTLAVGEYNKAQRANFQEPAVGGFIFSGNGRGCNEVQAQFKITEIAWSASGSLLKLHADFNQFCDDSKSPLKGSLRFSASVR